MAIGIRVYIDVCQVGDGSGAVMMGQSQANNPGQGQGVNPANVGSAQTRRYQDFVQVPGGDSPTLANILTALQTAATDFAGATGTPIITTAELAIINGWPSGSP